MDEDFFERVFEVVRLIPFGKVTSYGAIARYLGVVRSARMVGWVMSKADTATKFVPAHRVVNSSGLLTGKYHFSGEDVMQELLENEGIEVENDKIINFKKIFWDPSTDLE